MELPVSNWPCSWKAFYLPRHFQESNPALRKGKQRCRFQASLDYQQNPVSNGKLTKIAEYLILALQKEPWRKLVYMSNNIQQSQLIPQDGKLESASHHPAVQQRVEPKASNIRGKVNETYPRPFWLVFFGFFFVFFFLVTGSHSISQATPEALNLPSSCLRLLCTWEHKPAL